MKCKSDTMYEACVGVGPTGAYHRLHFVFDYDYHRITVKDEHEDSWKICPLRPDHVNMLYACQYGNWIFTIHEGNDIEWELHSLGTVYIPRIHEVNDKDPRVIDDLHGEMKGRHYDALIIDDMPVESCKTASGDAGKEVKRVVDWWRKSGGKKGATLDALIRKMFDECTSEKGGNEMTKQLYHVILFNKKTEKVDYKGYIPAEDTLEAGMLASQDGKYDADTHMVIIKEIDDSSYTKIE